LEDEFKDSSLIRVGDGLHDRLRILDPETEAPPTIAPEAAGAAIRAPVFFLTISKYSFSVTIAFSAIFI